MMKCLKKQKKLAWKFKNDIFSIIKKNSLNKEEEFKLFRYVEKKGMIFLSTPFSRNAVG